MTKIALLGDIHVGKFGRGNEFAVHIEENKDNTEGAASLVEGLIKHLKSEHVDYLFISGDLTSTGSPIEYTKSLEIIRKISSEAEIPPSNIVLSLGNHDVDRRIYSITGKYFSYVKDACSDSFNLIKSQYQEVAANVGCQFLDENNFDIKGPAPYSGIFQRESLDIFVLNSGWLCTPEPDESHGKLSSIQHEWFKEKANEFVDSSSWKILLLHHHLFNYPYPTLGREISLLEEGSDLLEVAGATGFHIICHGHRHHPRACCVMQTGWQNPITFICSGSFSVNAEHRGYGELPNCFHVFELLDESNRIIKLKNFEYKTRNGWRKFTSYTDETPLDPKMYFSRPFELTESKEALDVIIAESLENCNGELPEWESLPMELRTLRHDVLNSLIKKKQEEGYYFFGEYPKEVAVWRDRNE